MATPIWRTKTVDEAQHYFAAETQETRQQYATIVGGLIVATAPVEVAVEATLETVAAVGALITNETTRAELDDQDFVMLFGASA